MSFLNKISDTLPCCKELSLYQSGYRVHDPKLCSPLQRGCWGTCAGFHVHTPGSPVSLKEIRSIFHTSTVIFLLAVTSKTLLEWKSCQPQRTQRAPASASQGDPESCSGIKCLKSAVLFGWEIPKKGVWKKLPFHFIMRTRFSRIPTERKFQHIWKLILDNRNISIHLGERGNKCPTQSRTPEQLWALGCHSGGQGVLASWGHFPVPWETQGGDVHTISH